MSELLTRVDALLQQSLQGQAGGQADSRRLFHGRGCVYPGYEQVTVDLYAPVLWVTFFKANDDEQFEQSIVDGLVELAQRHGLQAVLVQRRYQRDVPAECAWGSVPETVWARRGQARYTIRLGERQNTGFFLDMEPGRQWLEQRARGKKVLNLFAYTCAFSVVAQQAGADSVVNVDMSRGALKQGQQNHQINGLTTSVLWRRISSNPGGGFVARGRTTSPLLIRLRISGAVLWPVRITANWCGGFRS